MDSRERFIETVLFGRPDRPYFHHSFGLMPGVIEKWHREGLPEDIKEDDIQNYFGFDLGFFPIPVNTSFYPQLEPNIIEENEEYVIKNMGFGKITKMYKKVSSLPRSIKFSVEKPEDWMEIKEFFKYNKKRFSDKWIREIEEHRKKGHPIIFICSGLYAMPRDLMGDERLCLWFYDYPYIIKDILNTYTELLCQLGEEIVSKVEVDVICFSEDICYKNGSIISPSTFTEFMLPHYEKIINIFRKGGTKIFSVDSDGNLSELIPLFIKAGINLLQPMEVKAGNDVVKYRQKYGRKMAFAGGLDKFALTKEKKEIDRELEYKIPEMLKLGGYIPGLDHRVVLETPLENFIYYVKRVKELIEDKVKRGKNDKSRRCRNEMGILSCFKYKKNKRC